MADQFLRFGSRGSALARRQTAMVAAQLQARFPGLRVETIIFSTKGDRELRKPLPEIGGKGLFTAELESALLQGEIDLAVHSLKDLPTEDASGLTVGAVLRREDPGDVLISRAGYTLAGLPPGASVGTGSLRRAAQLLARRPDLKILPLRGNVDTRLAKALAVDGPYDAVVLAAAGLKRMDLAGQASEQLPFEVMLPAPGQGAIAVQCRAGDEAVLSRLAAIDHPPTRRAVSAERAFLAGLNAGCSLPVGALAKVTGDALSIQGRVASLDGRQVVRVFGDGPAAEPERIGRSLADKALAEGAAALLEAAGG
ncbi:MAG: hydroxymethylbilane synthase [Anaerolineae bacterium]